MGAPVQPMVAHSDRYLQKPRILDVAPGPVRKNIQLLWVDS